MRSAFIFLIVYLAVLSYSATIASGQSYRRNNYRNNNYQNSNYRAATRTTTKTKSPVVYTEKCLKNNYKNVNGTCVFCPSGWKLLHNKCLITIEINSTVSWNEANQMCQKNEYGELLTIENDEPNFTHYLSQVSKLFGFSDRTHFYIGLRTKGWSSIWSFDSSEWESSEGRRRVSTDGPEWRCGNFKQSIMNTTEKRNCAFVTNTQFVATKCDGDTADLMADNYVCQKKTAKCILSKVPTTWETNVEHNCSARSTSFAKTTTVLVLLVIQE